MVWSFEWQPWTGCVLKWKCNFNYIIKIEFSDFSFHSARRREKDGKSHSKPPFFLPLMNDFNRKHISEFLYIYVIQFDQQIRIEIPKKLKRKKSYRLFYFIREIPIMKCSMAKTINFSIESTNKTKNRKKITVHSFRINLYK